MMMLAGLFFTACSQKVEITGAGATFPEPYYNFAFKNYTEKTGTNVSYGGVGSGGGIRSLKNEIVDFAGTDVIPDKEESAGMNPVIYIPMCRGAVVLSYNIPNVDKLQLNADVITGIYLDSIKNWNDSRIQAINPGVALPDLAITPVYRSDGSGTTHNFSEYMSDANMNWKQNLGVGKTLNFTTGIAAKGNPGVVGTIANTPGAIGYIGSEYAFSMNVPAAAIMNNCCLFIEPTTQAIADNSYPITCTTWIGIYKEQNYAGRSLAKAKHTLDLMQYMLDTETQKSTESIHYAPIPENDRQNALKALEEVTYDGVRILVKGLKL